MSVLADNVENRQLVHKDKIWTFTFNEKIEFEDIKKNSILVKNSEDKIVEVCFELQANKRSVLIKPPIDGYKPGEQYTLFLSTDIGSNENVINYITIEFIIENENILNNALDKKIIFDKRIFSVKDYDWLGQCIEYDISLENVVIGEQAWEIIKQSNRFNTAPIKDKEYMLAKFNIKLKKTDRDRYVKFDNKMFQIISENKKVYNPYECSIVLNGELDNKLIEGEVCSGWIAGLIDKGDNPYIVINEGKDSKVSFEIKNNPQSCKEDKDDEKNYKEDKEEKEEILTKEELLKYLEENKDILFKELMDNKQFEKFIRSNYLESNKKMQQDNVIFDLENKSMVNNNYTNSDNNNMIMMYLYQMLSENKGN